jgi:thiamine biosynthesis protein ThiI
LADTLFLVRYGEIGIKSLPVRRRFERLLADNIVRGLKARGAQGTVEQPWGRLLVRAPDGPGRDTLARTFGVVSFSPVREAPVELPELAAEVAQQAGGIPPGHSFAVRARRAGDVGFTSMDAARAVGASILQLHRARGLRVDLDAPDVEVQVEVRDGKAYVAFESVPGPGGLPVGSEGRVAVWADSGRGALAAWLMMKRGCRADLLAPRGLDPVPLLALAAWDPGIDVVDVPPSADRATVLAMLALHAARRGGFATALGDDFGDAMRLGALDRSVGMPVFRPLLALEPAMLEGAARRLGVGLDAGPPHAPGDVAAAEAEARARLQGARRRKVLA